MGGGGEEEDDLLLQGSGGWGGGNDLLFQDFNPVFIPLLYASDMFSIRCARGHAAEQNNDPVWMQGTGRDRVHAFRLLPTHSYNATLKGNQSKDGARLLLMGSLERNEKADIHHLFTRLLVPFASLLLYCVCVIYIYIYRTLINSLLC